MRAFFEYCEKNWREAGKEREKADKVLELIGIAKAKVDPESVYGERIALVDGFLNRLRGRLDTIGVATKRVDVPELQLAKAEGKVTIDGKLDEAMWKNLPASSGGHLKDLHTGEPPAFGTTFQMAWGGDGLYLAIRCEEDPDTEIAIGTTTQDDPAISVPGLFPVDFEGGEDEGPQPVRYSLIFFRKVNNPGKRRPSDDSEHHHAK